MKFFHMPTVYLISRPIIDWNEISITLANECMGTWQVDAPNLIEFAGRVCYQSFGEKQSNRTTYEYIRNIIEQGHGSVLEHINYTFLICRASRAFTHEMVRHRVGFAYSQESTRYCRYDVDSVRLCMPGQPEDLKEADKEAFEVSLKRYQEKMAEIEHELPGDMNTKKRKLIQTQARQLLPTAIEAKIVITANVRAIRHFLSMRGSENAALEMRLVAYQIAHLMRKECRECFQDMTINTANDNYPTVELKFPKV